jgi:hypothetical protein
MVLAVRVGLGIVRKCDQILGVFFTLSLELEIQFTSSYNKTNKMH